MIELGAQSYKEYLTQNNKHSREKLEKLLQRQKKVETKFREAKKLYKSATKELNALTNTHRTTLDLIQTEYRYKRKLNKLLKENEYLIFEGEEEDLFTLWVYIDKEFENEEDDPFYDDHFCVSYEEAYHRCIDYIKFHEKGEIK
tara:strand:- start:632 stop:1063 length:432 start_codon:yes stop_codon:yes gene_type:complete